MDLVSEAQKTAVLAILIKYLLKENISSLYENIKYEQYRIANELCHGRGYVTREQRKRDNSIPEIVYTRLNRVKLYPHKMSTSIGLFS